MKQQIIVIQRSTFAPDRSTHITLIKNRTERLFQQQGKTMKHHIINGALLIGAILFSCCIGEGLLILKNNNMKNYDIEMWRYAKILKRKSDNPMLGHEHLPNRQALLQSVNIRTNQFGLRGGDTEIHTSKRRRILFLGSSATLGWGVSEPETLTSRLQNLMGTGTEILNAGIGNYNTVRYVELFLTKLSILHPTDVVIHFFINDAEVLDAGGGNWLLRNSQFAVTLWQVANRFLNRTTEEDLTDYYKAIYQPDAIGYQAMLNAFDRLKTYTDKEGIRVYFVMTPDVHNLTDYKFHFIHDIMQREAESRAFYYIDLLTAFKGIEQSKTLWVMPTDPHPNGLAHKLMAEHLSRRL